MRLRTVVPIALSLGALAWVGTRGLGGALEYYVTPTEAVHTGRSPGEDLRVGGFVVPGSVRRHGVTTSFLLSDGRTRLPVVLRAGVPPLFRGGSGALVEGTLGPTGVLDGEDVLVKHSSVYRPPSTSSSAAPAP
jgi:cytochrome c-type biogenesis protein CcmE